ncbi:Transcription repressor OFP8 [Cardamine amara subsp. amara]|uniref:Transcription repressor n=1 Tax=Cardamine amara subsp. amara TaxID=228776 RepID=A0ABD0Z3C0_CARAN
MEKRMRLGVSRIVRSSLSSCRPRDLYDVVETCAVTSQAASSERFFSTQVKTKPPKPKSHHANNSCPRALPIFPPNPFYEESRSFRDLRKKIKTNRKQRSQFGSDPLFASRFKSTGSWYWSCSDDEENEGDKEESEDDDDDDDDTETLFSSKSVSSRSDSSKAESFAVVKKSKDPYEDFRTSMVEMIVERQIFAAAELQQLLQCFLSLNSRQHHKVIVQVFLEIYATLFSP